MPNLILGVITLCLCSLGYFISFRQFNKGSLFNALTLVVICGFILRCFVATDLYLHEWDEQFHALVAKNLLKHPFLPTLYNDPVLPYDYKNWCSNYIWVHKQPFPLWIMAFSMKFFGVNEIALRIPSILLSTLSIFITYRVGEYLFNRKVGFIAAFLFSIHGFIIELTGGRDATDHIDIFFVGLILLSVFFAIRFIVTKKPIYNILTGIMIGLAILSKWLPALIVIPVFFLLLLDSKKFSIKKIILVLLINLIVIVIVFLPWQIYILHRFPLESRWEFAYNFLHIQIPLNNLNLPFYYHFDHLQIKYGPMSLFAIFWFAYKSLKNRIYYRRLALLIWVIIPFIFFSFVKTKMPAYTLFTAPAILIIGSLMIHYLWRFRKRFHYQVIPKILIGLFFFFPFWQTIERTNILSIYDRNPEWVQEIKSLPEPATGKEMVIFNASYPIETMFYKDCIAYPYIPDTAILTDLKRRGYQVMILTSNNH